MAQPPSLPRSSVLGKAMEVLHAFHADDHGLRLTDIVKRTGLSKTTLHRLLADMTAAGLIDRVEDTYHLGSHLFELGMLASLERTLIEVATPFMEDLYERTHETVHLGVREGAEVVYVAKVAGHRGIRAPSRIGGRLPLHATGVGKALLAFAPEAEQIAVLKGGLERRTARTVTAPGRLRQQLAQVRHDGIAYEFEEAATGVVCVAAPILDEHQQPIAAVSIAGGVTRFHPPDHANVVRAAASGIAATLTRRSGIARDPK